MVGVSKSPQQWAPISVVRVVGLSRDWPGFGGTHA
jgi:hypothetical protein